MDDGTFIRIPVNLFGETNYLVVDTAAAITVIDASMQSRLGKPLQVVPAESAVGGQFELTLYQAPQIQIGDAVLGLQRVASADLQMARMISGEPCSGMLGADVFSNRVASFDFNRGILSISSNAPEATDKSFISLRKFPDGRLAVETTINKSEKVLLLVDSSDSSSLSFNQQDWDKIFKGASAEAGKIAFYSGVDGTVRKSQNARIATLTVGRQEYTNLLCSLIPNRGSTSHLGLGFLRRHVVTIDFAQSRMFLDRGSSFIHQDEDDMSGLHLLRKDGAVVVYAADQDSPAALAGFQPGDELTQVNGRKAASLSMRDIRQIFASGNGNTVTAEVKSNGNVRSVKLRLKRSI